MNLLVEVILGIVTLNICFLLFLYYLTIRSVQGSVEGYADPQQVADNAINDQEERQSIQETMDSVSRSKDLSGGDLGI